MIGQELIKGVSYDPTVDLRQFGEQFQSSSGNAASAHPRSRVSRQQ